MKPAYVHALDASLDGHRHSAHAASGTRRATTCSTWCIGTARSTTSSSRSSARSRPPRCTWSPATIAPPPALARDHAHRAATRSSRACVRQGEPGQARGHHRATPRHLPSTCATSPLSGDSSSIEVDGVQVFSGSAPAARRTACTWSSATTWQLGAARGQGARQAPGLERPAHRRLLRPHDARVRHAARREREDAQASSPRRARAAGPLWLWTVEQEVVADTAVTPEMIARRAPRAVRHAGRQQRARPHRGQAAHPGRRARRVMVGEQALRGQQGVGTRFIYPNPEAPERYVTVIQRAHPRRGAARAQLAGFRARLRDLRRQEHGRAAAPGARPNAALARGFFDAQLAARRASDAPP